MIRGLTLIQPFAGRIAYRDKQGETRMGNLPGVADRNRIVTPTLPGLADRPSDPWTITMNRARAIAVRAEGSPRRIELLRKRGEDDATLTARLREITAGVLPCR